MELHLNTRGAYLHVREQMFEVKYRKDGVEQKQQIAAFKVKSIWVGESIALSSDAVKLAVQHNIDIVFLEYDGFPLGRVWHCKLGSTTTIRKNQLMASCDGRSVYYTKEWLQRKLTNQSNLLTKLKKHREKHHAFLADKIAMIERNKAKIREVKAKHVKEVAEQLRGWEGTCGRIYFEAICHILPKKYQFKGRSQRPAADVFNAMLNYGYGMLYSKIEKALIIAGLDPFVGFFHRDGYNHKSMVFDFIEPYRCFVDKVVFTLCAAKKVNQSHYAGMHKGVGLTKEGKQLVVQSMNRYFEEEKVRYKGRNQTRSNIIQMDAHQFANELLDAEK